MRTALLYGIVSGLATGAWMFGEFAFGLHDDPNGAGRWTGFLALVFPFAFAWLLVRHDRRATWGATLLQGLVFGAAGGLVGGAAIFAYFAVANPKIAMGGAPVDPVSQAMYGLFGALGIGIALVLVCRVLARRQERA
jgi:predicted Co/Zn/Cd cation transporter (cation efflux family)